jgi:hypothetical protein
VQNIASKRVRPVKAAKYSLQACYGQNIEKKVVRLKASGLRLFAWR